MRDITLRFEAFTAYPDALKIKDTTKSDKSASYPDILLHNDYNGTLTATLCNKRSNFDFPTINFRSFNVVIFHFHLLMVCVYLCSFAAQQHILDLSQRGKLQTLKCTNTPVEL
jgi:hypothetical protein